MNPRVVLGLFLIIIGVNFWLGINLWSIFWPLVLIFIGLMILLRPPEKSNWDRETVVSEEDKIDEVVIFWGIDKKVRSENFRGGKIVTVFGAGKLDLSEAKMKEESVEMEVAAVFGGIEIIVPRDWSVSSSGAGVFGGFDNKAVTPKEKITGKMKIEGAAVFGGVTIRN